MAGNKPPTKKPTAKQVVEYAKAYGPSRARVCPAAGATVEDRVHWCVHLMARGEWFGNATRYELAELWGVSPETVFKHSAEASRVLRLSADVLAEERLAHAAYAERIQREALHTVNLITGLPDYAAALKANEQAAKFKGIDLDQPVDGTKPEAQRIEIKLLPPDPETPEQKP